LLAVIIFKAIMVYKSNKKNKESLRKNYTKDYCLKMIFISQVCSFLSSVTLFIYYYHIKNSGNEVLLLEYLSYNLE